MCGASILLGEVACAGCGGIISDEVGGEDRVIGNPIWGEIGVDLRSFQGAREEVDKELRRLWGELEATSAQRLFDGQLDDGGLVEAKFSLYGPRESFLYISKRLIEWGVDLSAFGFRLMRYEEIYMLRDKITRARGE